MPQLLNKEVGAIGYGLMGLTWRPNPCPLEQAFSAMRASLAAGCNAWNGGEFYGPPERNSLWLLKKYYEKYPEDAEKVVLSIKGAAKPDLSPDGSPEGVRRSVETCLEQMGGTGKIDLFECARKDPDVPLETTLKALQELIQEGKIGGIALSEVSAETIQQGVKVAKIAAVEVELSLWATEPLTNGIAKVCKENDIPIIAYSPIGRGFLTGQIKSPDDIPEGDFRRFLPRFQPENFEANMKLVKQLEQLAGKKKCTPAQLAIGWVLALSKRPEMPTIIPIPGATTAERVEENSAAVELSEQEMKEIDGILEGFEAKGDRYHAHGMKHVNG